MAYYIVRTLILCSVITGLFVQHVSSLALYADAQSSTFALVLCRGLDNALVQLRKHELSEHTVGAAWLEQDCVSIDPCAQTSSNEDPVTRTRLPAPAGVWLSGNSSALRLSHSSSYILKAEAGERAHNYGSLEFARVPEGLRVQACAPDFDLWRREGVMQCNQQTVVSVTTDHLSRACPGSRPHTLIDCVRPLQFDATSQTLLRLPAGDKMHFGSQTWTQACGTVHGLSGVAAALCADAAEFSISVPVAAEGSTSLVMYQFLEGYSCLRDDVLTGQGEILSRQAAPNRVRPCPLVDRGAPARVDAYTCGTSCDTGFVLRDGACVSVYLGLNSSCGKGFAATAQCKQDTETYYNCSQCPPRAGWGAADFSTDRPFECQYAACVPGTHSDGFTCEPCVVNTFSNVSHAVMCSSCDTVETGAYQLDTGKTACHRCLWNTSTLDPCAPGTELAPSFGRVQQLFGLYRAHQAELRDYVSTLCGQGYACLPCEPGHYERDRACMSCPHGTYQPNFGAQDCYACALGQNTSSPASTRSSDYICTPGHE